MRDAWFGRRGIGMLCVCVYGWPICVGVCVRVFLLMAPTERTIQDAKKNTHTHTNGMTISSRSCDGLRVRAVCM